MVKCHVRTLGATSELRLYFLSAKNTTSVAIYYDYLSDENFNTEEETTTRNGTGVFFYPGSLEIRRECMLLILCASAVYAGAREDY